MLLRSFSNPNTTYTVDKSAGHCSCPAYAARHWCKHLEALGRYKQTSVSLTATPSYSQALSAVVKCIRVRNTEEGTYWLKYCWAFRNQMPESQYRTVRRLLIGSAEDGHSIAVMETVAKNLTALLAQDVEFSALVAELIRICKVPNWWHPSTGGHDYIYTGMIAGRRTLYDTNRYNLDHCLLSMEKAIDSQDKIAALFWMNKADESRDDASLAIAHRLLEIGVIRKHSAAIRLTKNIHLLHSKTLHDDNNFIGQAAWLLAGGVSPVIDHIETVTKREIQEILDKVNATEPYPIPEWCCDGVHCAGNDVRYMGMFSRMFAVCNQFNHYHRVQPDDIWLEDSFYSLDGLEFKPLVQNRLAV